MAPSAMRLAVLALVFAAAAASASEPSMEDVILGKTSLADFPRANVDYDSLPPVSFDDYVNIFKDSPNNDFVLPSDSRGEAGLGFPFGDTTGASTSAPAPAPAVGEVARRAPAVAISTPPPETPAAKPPSGSGGKSVEVQPPSPPAPGAGSDVSDLVPSYGAYGPDQAVQAPGPGVEDELHVGGASAGVVSAGAVVAALLAGAVAVVC